MSGDSYKIENQNGIYFLTFTIIDWCRTEFSGFRQIYLQEKSLAL
jgi:hypothetical protein